MPIRPTLSRISQYDYPSRNGDGADHAALPQHAGWLVYGFAPEGTLSEALKQGPRTTIKGLWLASAYAGSGGFTGAMFGGALAAWEAMQDTGARTKAA